MVGNSSVALYVNNPAIYEIVEENTQREIATFSVPLHRLLKNKYNIQWMELE